MSQSRQGGEAVLDRRLQGRPPESRLTGGREAVIVALIESHCPDQLGLPGALWTRETVGALIKKSFGLSLSVWTVGHYLRRWGLTPQKPDRRAYQQNPEAVRHWLEVEYPEVRKQAQGGRGGDPLQGTLRFRVFHENFNGVVFIDFLHRLVRDRGSKVYLIVDRHPVHVSRKVRAWVERHQAEIRLVDLPPYSLELNPGEFLNQDVKSNAAGRWRPATKGRLMGNLRSYLRSTQKFPDVVRRFFHAAPVRYAAA